MDRFSLQEHLQDLQRGPHVLLPLQTRVAIACLLPIRLTALSFGELQIPSFPLPAPVKIQHLGAQSHFVGSLSKGGLEMAEISGPDAVPKFSLLQHVEGKVNSHAPKGCSGDPFRSPRESRRAPSFQRETPPNRAI